MATATSSLNLAVATGAVAKFNATPLCSSAYLLTWIYSGTDPQGFEIERRADFGEDRTWRRIGQVPARARRYESTGLLGGSDKKWSHRVRPILPGNELRWAECAGAALPNSSGGPRGQLLVAPTQEAPRNISGSFVKLRNGELLYMYTASSGMGDYARSWFPILVLTTQGKWESRGALRPESAEWPCISRPSLVRMPSGAISLTYTITKAKTKDSNEHATSQFIHRTVRRTSTDEARTWSPEQLISDNLYDFEMVNSNGARDLVLSNGRFLTNVHVCKPPCLAAHDPFQGTDNFNEVMGTYLLLSDDEGRTFKRVPERKDQFFFTPDDPYGRKRIGFWEIAVVEYAPGKLLMYARNASGWLYETRSHDFGSTWSEPKRTHIPYPIAPPNLTRIPGTSTLVLLTNPHVNYASTFDGGYRSILATQLSDDAGETWYGYRELEYDGDANADPFWSLYSYPDFIWDDDKLHVIYSRKFEQLYYQCLTREWLLGR